MCSCRRPFHPLVILGFLFAASGIRAPAAETATSPQPPAVATSFDRVLQQSRATEANDAKRAVALAREALALAVAVPPPGRAAELRARTRLGEALRLASQYPEARIVVDAGLALPAAAVDRLERAQLIQTSAQIHWNVGDYGLAEAANLTAQQEAEALGDRGLMIRALSLRGILARRQDQLEPAAQHLRAGLALARQEGDPDLLAQVRTNLANVLTDSGALGEARALHEENLRYRTDQGDRRGQGNSLLNLGSVESKAGNYAAATDYYARSLAVRRELGVPRQIAAAQIALAGALTRLGRTDEALAQLRAAASSVGQLASHDVSQQLYAQFATTHAARGEFREAFDAQRQAERANTAMVGAETARTVAELRERFDAEKRSREIAELRGDQQRKSADLAQKETEIQFHRRERYALAALAGLGALAVVALVGRQRARTRAERFILAETRRARDAAEQANALKTQLLDLASHDLKAPLVGVMMTAQLIAKEAADRPAIAQSALDLTRESQRMFDLVQNLLDTSALESGERMLLRQPMDLAALARDTAPALEARLARKRQRLDVATDPVCPLEGDPLRLRQVLENLVDNASKFSLPGKTVRVVVRHTAAHARLEVHDQGPGLTDDDRQHLFERFRRLSARPTAGESSTGLGLALVHDLVTQHGGLIWAEPASDGGSAFIAEFPLAGVTR